MSLDREISKIYKDYYESLSRGKKAELTRFTNFLEEECRAESKTMSKILACMLTGRYKITEPLDSFINYGKRRK